MLGQNPIPRAPALGGDVFRGELRAVLSAHIAAVERNEVRLQIPRPLHLMLRRAGMHYHFHPELFFQIDGESLFRFPEQKLTLRPGDLGVIPTGLPHGERATAGTRPFRNLVIGFYSNSVSMHFAAEMKPGMPDIEAIAFYPTPKLRQVTELIETLIDFHYSTSPQRATITRGALLTLLAILADLADGEIPPLAQNSQRIFQLKWIVRDRLHSPDLSVMSIARQLNCTPDYLSHLFHREAGETLIHYIHQQRILGAAESLANSTLSISEIAWACGFSDAGYFSRIFRRLKGVSPLAYRRKLQQQSHNAEAQPKTIYHKRVDYSAGQPWSQRATRARRSAPTDARLAADSLS